MKKCFLLRCMVLSMAVVPCTIHAHSFLTKHAIVAPSWGNISTNYSADALPKGVGGLPATPLYKIHATPNTKTITVQGGVSYMGNFSCGLAMIKWKNGWFAINQNGEKVFDLPAGYWPGDQYKTTYYEFDQDRLIICKDAQHALNHDIAIIDTQGKIIKEFKNVTSFSSFLCGVAIVKDDKYNFFHIDRDGNVLSRTLPAYETMTGGPVIGYMREGMRRFYDGKAKRYGYCDEKCNIVLPAQFKGVGNFFNGLAKAKNEDDLWGYIDKTGKFVINPMFSVEPGSFYNDYALVQDKAGKKYFIDRTGQFVWQEPATGGPQRIYDFNPEVKNGAYALWVYDRVLNIVDSSFKRRAKLPEVFETSGMVAACGDDWFQWKDSDQNCFLYDWNGRLLLRFGQMSGYSCFSEGLCRHAEDRCYFNMKGEIVIQFRDTQF